MKVEPRCPAARAITYRGGDAVLCTPMADAKRHADQITEGTYSEGIVTERHDTRSYYGFCCGDGEPVVDSVPEGGRNHYTACPIWRRFKEAQWAGEPFLAPAERPSDRGLGLPAEPAPNLRGQSPNEAAHAAVEEMARNGHR